MALTKSIKFHAGKVKYDEETNRCTPLPYKGVISIKPSTEEPDFLDFIWTPKQQDQTQQINGSQQIEKDELLLIPGDVSIKIIKSCNTGRVFSFTFSSSGAKYLYWLQDIGDIDNLSKFTEKDNKLIQQINTLISTENDGLDEDKQIESNNHMEPEQLQQDQTLPSSYEASTTLQPPQIPKFKMPLGSISSVLNLQTIENHLDKLSREELSKLYKDYLPESTSKNVTKYKIIEIIRSGFYQQNEQKLSEHLKSGEGAGYLLSQSLKYDYKGEGIENFLNGIRDLGKKEQKEEENEGKDTEMN